MTAPPSRYYILRNVKKNPPLFSERTGYNPFNLIAQVGDWQLGWK